MKEEGAWQNLRNKNKWFCYWEWEISLDHSFETLAQSDLYNIYSNAEEKSGT